MGPGGEGPDVVGVGANSVDFVYRLPACPRPESPFSKLPIRTCQISCGGQVTTTLATCAAMGLRASYIGTIGSDENGQRMRAELTRRGVDAAHAARRAAPNPFALILLDENTGERIVLWHRDPGVALEARDLNRNVIGSARLLHVDDVDVEASVAAAAVARERRLPITSDIERTDDAVRALVDAVTVPIFAEHVPTALTGEDDLERALAGLMRPHHAMLCVTCGARGAVLLDRHGIHRVAGIAVRTTDTTGAGDIFRGAFIHALLEGRAPAGILRFANAAAALSCTRPGAMGGIPTLREVTSFELAERPEEARG